jgi:exopolysaccharide production protein ExoQ
MLATFGFARLAARERTLVVAGGAAIVLPLLVLIALLAANGTLVADWTHFLTQDLGKDTTLTGRTMLWQYALGEIAKRPYLGTGYYAFWLPGNLLAESIWRYFDVRGGFSFHDTYLETAVNLGCIGAAVLVVTLVLAMQRSVRLALADQGWATAALVGVMFCLVTRTIAEVDAPYPFAAGTFLLFAAASYGADYAALVRRSARVGDQCAVTRQAPPAAKGQGALWIP